MPFIKVIDEKDATGPLKEVYEKLGKSRGKIADVHKILSLDPKAITVHMDLYMKVMFGKSVLSRAQKEMLAVVVSVANDCEYCQRHHLEALNFFWKNPDRCQALRKDFRQVDLCELDHSLCQYAFNLTKNPGDSHEDIVMQLKLQSLDDKGVMEANLVVSYFNFVNRLVLGLGVAFSEEDAKGYKYE